MPERRSRKATKVTGQIDMALALIGILVLITLVVCSVILTVAYHNEERSANMLAKLKKMEIMEMEESSPEQFTEVLRMGVWAMWISVVILAPIAFLQFHAAKKLISSTKLELDAETAREMAIRWRCLNVVLIVLYLVLGFFPLFTFLALFNVCIRGCLASVSPAISYIHELDPSGRFRRDDLPCGCECQL